MILPNPVDFLTACEYQEVDLGHALGDELFLALHLIMKGSKNYMKCLEIYHKAQKNALPHRCLRTLRELKMRELADYSAVPTPEEIRIIVAECVTASKAFLEFFIESVEEYRDVVVQDERNNTPVLNRIGTLKGICHGNHLSKAVCDILSMPASAVGVCNSFHYSDVLMLVAMRQFGISLLVVHDDDMEHHKWPYQTVNFLDQLGSKVFLPLTFGLIHIARDGNMGILRKRRERVEIPSEDSKQDWYVGYALEMKTHIRTGRVRFLDLNRNLKTLVMD
jgi:hypothetical protein